MFSNIGFLGNFFLNHWGGVSMRIKRYGWLVVGFLLAGCASDHHELYTRKPALYSYIIGNLEDGHIVAEHAADVYATPASCQKVITALLVYKALGPDFKFETKAYVTKRKNSVHSVIIVPSGDPTLTSEQLKDLLAPFQGKTIKGNIAIETGLFHTPEYSKNIMLNDVGTSYAPPVSSLSLDQNIIGVTVTPTQIGTKALLENDAGYTVENTITTVVEPSSVKLSWEGDHIIATGCMKLSDPPLTFKISPPETKVYIAQKMKRILKELKIKAKIVFANDVSKTLLNKELFTSVVSEPLGKIIPPALKKSDNFVFDCLYLKLIHDRDPLAIKDWNDGDKVIKALLKEYFHIDMQMALLVDGSGLSRYNRLKPRQLFEILRQGYTTKEFVTALATPGEANSTLEKRKLLPTDVKAKTGTLSGISCLCGYRISENNPKAFVIMANSFSPPASELFPIVDNFLIHYLE